MNAHRKRIVPEATGALGKSTRPARTQAQVVTPFGRRTLLALLNLALTAALGFISAGRATAQTQVNNDGAFPAAGLVLMGNTLYGTAQQGGTLGHGAVFALNTDGTGFTNLYSLNASDGMNPYGCLAPSGNTLFGTANCGGGTGACTVFRVNIDGSSFAPLYNFAATTGFPSTNSDGADPYAGLILSGNTLYGTAEEGGTAGGGAVFAVNTDGTQFTNLHSFTATSSDGTNDINSDGAGPLSSLILYAVIPPR